MVANNSGIVVAAAGEAGKVVEKDDQCEECTSETHIEGEQARLLSISL